MFTEPVLIERRHAREPHAERVTSPDDGQLSMEDFGANHVKVLAGDPGPVEELLNLVSAAMEHMAS